ncbi:2-C-methyl-D-erythritol 4-phosphate cytidylyltransferase [Methylocucumis oryzae]|uniref:2-C-methyl-D-erythritol 4-phosphate cytidylyltransferase n=1 Tax=Methylocucumis oryzae TaxID=1632867 RepID=A0A0F3IGF3_9GAMM|nr:2-C-methyl-D-erythritol 4-phosphate cytidylyltransferase [Methylocucumis oryzae]KJV05772.1 2-C-methyl-D-erythritol 4-phosphate cytidylyltransferase [Methylocucumis oryzae]
MTQTTHYWAVVPAAGVGKRMQADRPKQYLLLAGKPVLEQTLIRLLSANIFSQIAVAITPGDPYWPELAIVNDTRIITAPGGTERADSVLSGLNALADKASDQDWVFVHDAARPCLTAMDIYLLRDELANEPVGGILALPSHDTLKQVDARSIMQTIDRNTIWRALTPQMFRYGLLKQALTETAGNPAITDEASALELLGYTPKIVAGRPDNIKITRPEDLALAAFFLEQQALWLE